MSTQQEQLEELSNWYRKECIEIRSYAYTSLSSVNNLHSYLEDLSSLYHKKLLKIAIKPEFIPRILNEEEACMLMYDKSINNIVNSFKEFSINNLKWEL